MAVTFDESKKWMKMTRDLEWRIRHFGFAMYGSWPSMKPTGYVQTWVDKLPIHADLSRYLRLKPLEAPSFDL